MQCRGVRDSANFNVGYKGGIPRGSRLVAIPGGNGIHIRVPVGLAATGAELQSFTHYNTTTLRTGAGPGPAQRVSVHIRGVCVGVRGPGMGRPSTGQFKNRKGMQVREHTGVVGVATEALSMQRPVEIDGSGIPVAEQCTWASGYVLEPHCAGA